MDKDRYAVMGNPISHSKSPVIHKLFAEQTGQDMVYEAILVDRDGFIAAVRLFQQDGGKGLNITVPFKQEAWALVDRHSDRAELAGAVNTIVLQADGQLYGENTDGLGMVRDLVENHGIPLTAKRILLLGAGGAARGVLGPVLEQHPASVFIANRTEERALHLAQQFRSHGLVQGGGFDALGEESFDLIVNGTTASLEGEVPPIPASCIASGTCCYDMMYGLEPTPFLHWAREHGAGQYMDGLGMLVEQAAESFALWRGVRPDTRPVIAFLREQMRSGGI
jgi:shikimate dehydrogenase